MIISNVTSCKDSKPTVEVIHWEEFARRLSTPRRADITEAAYRDLPKADRVKYKDGPGYIGGGNDGASLRITTFV